MNETTHHCRVGQGFSLVEIMIAMVILGILMSTAATAYGRYIVKAHRQDAISLLSGTVLRLERCFTLEGSYDGTCTLKSLSDEGHYSLVASRQAQSYTLSAVPVAGGRQANDSECATFVIDSTGDKTASGSLGRACW